MSQKRSKLLPFVSTVPPSYESKEIQTFAICSLTDAHIEPLWTLNVTMKRFLLHQETKTVIFSSNIGLEFMALSKKVLADGTFKTALPPFFQF